MRVPRWRLLVNVVSLLVFIHSFVNGSDIECPPPYRIAKVPQFAAKDGCDGIAKYFGFPSDLVVKANPERQACASERMSVCLPKRRDEEGPCLKSHNVQSPTETCASIVAGQGWAHELPPHVFGGPV